MQGGTRLWHSMGRIPPSPPYFSKPYNEETTDTVLPPCSRYGRNWGSSRTGAGRGDLYQTEERRSQWLYQRVNTGKG